MDAVVVSCTLESIWPTLGFITSIIRLFAVYQSEFDRRHDESNALKNFNFFKSKLVCGCKY